MKNLKALFVSFSLRVTLCTFLWHTYHIMSSLGEEVEEEWEDERVEADSLLGNGGCWIPKAIHLLQSAPKRSPSEAVPNPTHKPSGTLSFKVSHITSSEYTFRLSDTSVSWSDMGFCNFCFSTPFWVKWPLTLCVAGHYSVNSISLYPQIFKNKSSFSVLMIILSTAFTALTSISHPKGS